MPYGARGAGGARVRNADRPHGTLQKSRTGCKCRECRDVYAAHMRERRAAGHDIADRAYERARAVVVRWFREEDPGGWVRLIAECRAELEAERSA